VLKGSLRRAIKHNGAVADRNLRVGGELRRVPLERLEPDALNPRLPPRVQRDHLDPAALYPYLDRAYDVVSIAESIARHGYFEAEPLVAVSRSAAYPEATAEGADDRLVVVEGNRRLAALKGLTDPELRATFKSAGWKRLPDDVVVPETLPVLVVESREKAAPILGFRHITRAAPWEPLPQAKYIADLIDGQGRSFGDVADLLSRPEPEVRSLYRNWWVRRQADEIFGLEDIDRIDDNFGTFTRAMQNPGVRGYIDAPAPRDVDPEYLPLPDESKDRLAELVTWMFGQPRQPGDEDSRRPRPGQMLLDSRQITAFGGVLADPSGPPALRTSETLREAQEALGDPNENLLRALRTAYNAVRRALQEPRDEDEHGQLEDLLAALSEVLERYEQAGHAGAGA
jgi:hypothetical protein